MKVATKIRPTTIMSPEELITPRLLLGWVTAKRTYPCKQPACPAIGGGSEVTFKPLVPRLSVRETFLALTSPDKPLAKKPAQKQISEKPRAGVVIPEWSPSSGGEWDKHLLRYPGSLHSGVRLAAKWQSPGQGKEQAGECRAVVGILGEGGGGDIQESKIGDRDCLIKMHEEELWVLYVNTESLAPHSYVQASNCSALALGEHHQLLTVILPQLTRLIDLPFHLNILIFTVSNVLLLDIHWIAHRFYCSQ
ncbi:hypothetical protein J6590_002693 [Homalodisca vitripennis]|nr:hypothetical protein J6590_002693 [Homalodisca vitripennis]